MEGYYVYEVGGGDLDPDPHVGDYRYSSQPSEMVVRIGTAEFRSDSLTTDLRVEVRDSVTDADGLHDFLSILDQSVVGSWATGLMGIQFRDSTATALPNDSLPLTAPILNNYSEQEFFILGDGLDFVIEGVLTSISTGISSRPPARSPSILRMHPNPFSETANIWFTLEQEMPVTIDVWSVTGRRVRTIAARRRFPVGENAVTWDGLSNEGRPVAAGVYFVRARTRYGESVLRAVLIR